MVWYFRNEFVGKQRLKTSVYYSCNLNCGTKAAWIDRTNHGSHRGLSQWEEVSLMYNVKDNIVKGTTWKLMVMILELFSKCSFIP